MRYLLLAVSLTFSFYASAQTKGFHYGLRLGIGQSNFRGTEMDDQIGKLALYGGLTSYYQFTRNFGIQTDILWVSKGARARDTEVVPQLLGANRYDYTDIYQLILTEIPLLAKISIGGDNFFFKIYAGPSINFNLWSLHTRRYDNEQADLDRGFVYRNIPNTNLIELAGVTGLGIDIEMHDRKIIFLDFRSSIAFSPFATINSLNAYNNYFTINLGYMY